MAVETNSDVTNGLTEFIHGTVEYLYALCIMHRIAGNVIRCITATGLKLISIEIDVRAGKTFLVHRNVVSWFY